MMAINPSGHPAAQHWAAMMKKVTTPPPVPPPTPFDAEALAARQAELLAQEAELNRSTCPWCHDTTRVGGPCYCSRTGCTLPDCPALDGPMSTARLPIPTFLPKDAE